MSHVIAVVALGLACAGWVLAERIAIRGGARPLSGPCSGSCHTHDHPEGERERLASGRGPVDLPR